jgi:RNase P/RNase MRP subunit p29
MIREEEDKIKMKIGLIGRYARVIETPNRYEKDIEGIIRKETRNTLLINNKLILKNKRVFMIDNKKIHGKNLIGEFHDRIKE